MLFLIQKKSFCFDRWTVLCNTWNLNICSKVGGNFEGFLGNPREIPHIGCKILGVYRIYMDRLGIDYWITLFFLNGIYIDIPPYQKSKLESETEELALL